MSCAVAAQVVFHAVFWGRNTNHNVDAEGSAVMKLITAQMPSLPAGVHSVRKGQHRRKSLGRQSDDGKW